MGKRSSQNYSAWTGSQRTNLPTPVPAKKRQTKDWAPHHISGDLLTEGRLPAQTREVPSETRPNDGNTQQLP